MTILSTAGTIHCLQYYLFVYQVLRTFNMLTKSKISEARFQVRRTCNHVEHRRYDTFVYQVLPTFNMLTKSKISEARCSDVEDIVTMLSTAGAIHSCFQISKKFVNMLSIEDAIHSYNIHKTNNTSKNL